MKRILYQIENIDEPDMMWRLDLDGTVQYWSASRKVWDKSSWDKDIFNFVFTNNENGSYRIIPKREAKSLFPEAFK